MDTVKFNELELLLTTEIPFVSSDGPMLMMPTARIPMWIEKESFYYLTVLEKEWPSSDYISFSSEISAFILGNEPTLIHYSLLAENEGFILWRWLFAPKGWQHPSIIASAACEPIGTQISISVKDTEWSIFDPLDDAEDICKSRIKVALGSMLVSSFKYAPSNSVCMHFHLFTSDGGQQN